MKRFYIPMAIAASISLSGCAAIPAAISTIGGLNQAISVNQDKVLVPATQALIVAHNAYQGAASAATLAVNGCQITKTLPPCVKLNANLDALARYNDEAKALLDKADAGQNVAANSAGVMNLVANIHALIGVNNGR